MPTTPGFTSCTFGLETNTQRFESPVTRNVQRMILAGARWNASYSLPAMNRRQAQPWKAFFMRLEGSANTFNGFDPDARTPLGTAQGSPAVNGAGQTGSSLVTDGWLPSTVGLLKAGDYFSIGGELKMLTQDVGSNGGGGATLNFKPALRASPADNAILTITRAACAMILTDDRQGMWECDRNGIYQPKSFTAVEVF